MSKRKSQRLNEKNEKKVEKRLSDNTFIQTVVAIRNEQRENIPPYMYLIDDCWLQIFDLLSIADILEMSKTCKKMQNICGYYLNEYLPNLLFTFREKTIFASYPYCIQINPDYFKFVTTLTIESLYLQRLDLRTKTFFSSSKNFDSLKTIQFINNGVRAADLSKISNALSCVEVLLFRGVYSFNGGIAGQIEQCCKNLKKLTLINCYHGEEIFECHFPKLEYFCYKPYDNDSEAYELSSFLDNHKNLKHFACNWRFLWNNEDAFADTIVKIDEITIHFTDRQRDKNKTFDTFFNLIKSLHHKKTFKWLNVSLDIFFNIYHAKEIPSYLIDLCKTVPIKNLEFLSTSGLSVICLAKNITTVENVRIPAPTVENITHFILYAENLKSIRIGNLNIQPYKKRNLINDLQLVKLNNERKRNPNARRIFFYMHDRTYIQAKKQVNNLNLSHIEIKRLA